MNKLLIINSFLGECDFLNNLKKSEDFDKIEIQIVPRIILSFLSLNLNDKDVESEIDLPLPVNNAKLSLKKVSGNRYNGTLLQDGSIVATFNFKTIPSIALIIMSVLDLYDIMKLDDIKKNPLTEDKSEELKESISERLLTNKLIAGVMDKKIEEKDAIHQLINTKLANSINKMIDKKENMKEKIKKEEEMSKQQAESGVSIKCPDCGSPLYKGGDKIKLCVCYGEFFGHELKIKKSEQTGKISINFPKKFGIDNIDMLLETVKDQTGDKK